MSRWLSSLCGTCLVLGFLVAGCDDADEPPANLGGMAGTVPLTGGLGGQPPGGGDGGGGGGFVPGGMGGIDMGGGGAGGGVLAPDVQAAITPIVGKYSAPCSFSSPATQDKFMQGQMYEFEIDGQGYCELRNSLLGTLNSSARVNPTTVTMMGELTLISITVPNVARWIIETRDGVIVRLRFAQIDPLGSANFDPLTLVP